MKILQINNVYQTDSTGKITFDLHKELLAYGCQSIVCYGRGKRIKEKDVYKICGEFYSRGNHVLSYYTGLPFAGLSLSTNRLIRIIKKEEPCVVHLQCLNGYFVNIYRLLSYLKISGIPTIITLHAEFMYTGGCGHALGCTQWREEPGCYHCAQSGTVPGTRSYMNTKESWKRMREAFDGWKNVIIISVSPWLMERAKQSTILRDKNHKLVLNGIDTQIFCQRDYTQLRRKHHLSDEKIIFHVTASFSSDPHHLKGGYYVLQLAEHMKTKRVIFIVAGNCQPDLIPPPNMIILGKIKDQNLLAQYYSMANLTVLTSQRETFSMVCAESLCCGTPVVGFQAGAPEQISLEEYSEFVEYRNLFQLERTVNKWLNRQVISNCIADKAKSRYSKEKMAEQYMDIYQKIGLFSE